MPADSLQEPAILLRTMYRIAFMILCLLQAPVLIAAKTEI
jgi:hypothetical protein